MADEASRGGSGDGTSGSGPPASPRPVPDLTRSALEAARSAARKENGIRRRRVAGRAVQAGRPGMPHGGYSSSGPDPRDPAKVGSLVRRLFSDRGWEQTAAAATVVGDWDRLVGAEIAVHARPTSLVDGELILVAESTAWATQLRLLEGRLRARISAEVGPDVVRRIRVHGPTAPSWQRGPRRVAGRGPRDTYG
jgi:predicted nucleic acid-binding Zn ribbon protein